MRVGPDLPVVLDERCLARGDGRLLCPEEGGRASTIMRRALRENAILTLMREVDGLELGNALLPVHGQSSNISAFESTDSIPDAREDAIQEMDHLAHDACISKWPCDQLASSIRLGPASTSTVPVLGHFFPQPRHGLLVQKLREGVEVFPSSTPRGALDEAQLLGRDRVDVRRQELPQRVEERGGLHKHKLAHALRVVVREKLRRKGTHRGKGPASTNGKNEWCAVSLYARNGVDPLIGTCWHNSLDERRRPDPARRRKQTNAQNLESGGPLGADGRDKGSTIRTIPPPQAHAYL